jgi:CheY-like chemotaxis protein
VTVKADVVAAVPWGLKEKPGASVLFVDDNISLCTTMSFILDRKGFAVSIAHSGPEAVRLVEERPFEVIFLDMRLPGIDGVETYRQIKAIRPNATVVMMTAYALEALIQQALEEGAQGIIYKPLDIDAVLTLIEEAGNSPDTEH